MPLKPAIAVRQTVAGRPGQLAPGNIRNQAGGGGGRRRGGGRGARPAVDHGHVVLPHLRGARRVEDGGGHVAGLTQDVLWMVQTQRRNGCDPRTRLCPVGWAATPTPPTRLTLEERRGGAGGGGGGLGPKSLCTKMARPDYPGRKFRFFRRWSLERSRRTWYHCLTYNSDQSLACCSMSYGLSFGSDYRDIEIGWSKQRIRTK